MLVKIMSAEDLPDCDSRKCFRLIEDVNDVVFTRDRNGEPRADLSLGDGASLTLWPEGNVYLLSGYDGQILAEFGVAECPVCGDGGDPEFVVAVHGSPEPDALAELREAMEAGSSGLRGSVMKNIATKVLADILLDEHADPDVRIRAAAAAQHETYANQIVKTG